MSFKKGDIVTVSNKLEEYVGTALILYRDDEMVDIKIIDEHVASEDVPDGRILLGYESYSSIYAVYCDVLEKADEAGVIKLRISKTFSVINRRFSTRYPAFFKVDIAAGEPLETFDGVIRNMSLRGFMVNTHVDLSVNHMVEMGIKLDSRNVSVKARVARKSGQGGSFNYGLYIVDLGYDEKILMRSMVTELKEKNRKISEKLIRGYIGEGL
ncbi:PilZ domain-containing protein [Acetivibrio cellulolyticus]|uniref:PilZ domain-containing protein n=1 Tax=Acetivibrio cellulolyticus TaxID=35830 RepID=UPI0001E2E6E6|nr:PilZ domain-containing protein [Acetivibrio cellulolyticus]